VDQNLDEKSSGEQYRQNGLSRHIFLKVAKKNRRPESVKKNWISFGRDWGKTEKDGVERSLRQ